MNANSIYIWGICLGLTLAIQNSQADKDEEDRDIKSLNAMQPPIGITCVYRESESTGVVLTNKDYGLSFVFSRRDETKIKDQKLLYLGSFHLSHARTFTCLTPGGPHEGKLLGLLQSWLDANVTPEQRKRLQGITDIGLDTLHFVSAEHHQRLPGTKTLTEKDRNTLYILQMVSYLKDRTTPQTLNESPQTDTEDIEKGNKKHSRPATVRKNSSVVKQTKHPPRDYQLVQGGWNGVFKGMGGPYYENPEILDVMKPPLIINWLFDDNKDIGGIISDRGGDTIMFAFGGDDRNNIKQVYLGHAYEVAKARLIGAVPLRGEREAKFLLLFQAWIDANLSPDQQKQLLSAADVNALSADNRRQLRLLQMVNYLKNRWNSTTGK